jgi:hypothetical protein
MGHMIVRLTLSSLIADNAKTCYNDNNEGGTLIDGNDHLANAVLTQYDYAR